MSATSKLFSFLSLGLWPILLTSISACGGSSGGNSISGKVSGDVQAGVTMTLSGDASQTATTDSLGQYAFSDLADGSYSITPTLSGYRFTPPSQSVAMIGSDVTAIDFTATAASGTYTLSGVISGEVKLGVLLTLSGTSSATATSDVNGAYQFTGLAVGSYTVTPGLTGYTFSPTNRAVTIAGTNAIGINFTAFAVSPTYAISGTISGDAFQGVLMILTGDSSASTTTDENGTYQFTGLPNGSYTVSPSLVGYTFSPTELAVTISSNDVSDADFTSTVVVPTYTLSGTVSGEVQQGVLITLSGAGSATATTSANGTYQFTGLTAGGYTVTPSLSGYTFSPASHSVTISSGNVADVNFVGSAVIPTYNLSGTVSGDVLQGVTITLVPIGRATTTTDASGNYLFTGLENGSYIVTPSLTGYTFSPVIRQVTISGSDLPAIDFTATAEPTTFTISGTVSGDIIQGVDIILLGDRLRYTTTDSDGFYHFAEVSNGNYTIIAQAYPYSFSPPDYSVTINNADVTDRDFVATQLPTYTISGTITGVVQQGVGVYLTGDATRTQATGAGGTFQFSNLLDGNYTVTPGLPGYTFDPMRVNVTLAGADQTGIEFVSSVNINTYKISGLITGDIQAGVLVTLSGDASDTFTTDATGAFEFTDLANGSYTVTPTRAGYTFTPESRNIGVLDVDVSYVDFTAEAASIYGISGAISGDVQEGVSVVLKGPPGTSYGTTDSNGDYSFYDLPNGTYSVQPALSGYLFDPISRSVTIDSADATGQDFLAILSQAPTYSISGQVMLNSQGIGEVNIHLVGPQSGSIVTDNNGHYVLQGLIAGNYTITPEAGSTSFTPNSRNVNITSSDVSGVNFEVMTYSINGVAYHRYGGPLANATISIAPALASPVTTDSNGWFQIAGLPNGDYILTPSLNTASYLFTPKTQTVTIANGDVNDVMFLAQVAYRIFGTIQYAGQMTGRVYVNVRWSNGDSTSWGTSVSGASYPAAFEIRGVNPGNYQLVATMDHMGAGDAHVSDPGGVKTDINVMSADVDAGVITLIDPDVSAPPAPSNFFGLPFDQGIFFMWGVNQDQSGRPLADYFNLYWSTDPEVSPTHTNGGGSQLLIPTQKDMGFFLVTGLTNDASYYFMLTAETAGLVSAPSATSQPVLVGTPVGQSVSGEVTFTGFEPQGTMWMAAMDANAQGPQPGSMFVNAIPITANPQPYTLPGIPIGTYRLYVLLDMNNDGNIGVGEIKPNDNNAPVFEILEEDVVQDVTQNAGIDEALIGTSHEMDLQSSSEWYSVWLDERAGLKLPVRVTLVSGANILAPMDIGNDRGSFSAWFSLNGEVCNVGDQYQLEIEYSDGSVGITTLTIDTVLNSFPTPLDPIGSVPGNTQPTFSWQAPGAPPAFYTYSISVFEDQGPFIWGPNDDFPSTQTSVDFNYDGSASIDPLLTGEQYIWDLRVRDQMGNQAAIRTAFTP